MAHPLEKTRLNLNVCILGFTKVPVWVGVFILAIVLAAPCFGQNRQVESRTLKQAISDQLFDKASRTDEPIRRIGLSGPVKIVFDDRTNSIMLVGSEKDVAIVKQTILTLKDKLAGNPKTVVTRVRLEYQLADTVVEILENSLQLESSEKTSLKINAIHFPEAVILSGSARAVNQARELIKKIDALDDHFSLEYRGPTGR